MRRRKHKVLEVSGRDIDEAIANGLAQLGFSRDEVLIEILNRGRRRLLGLSTEPAQVRILYPAEEAGEEEGARQVAREEAAPSLSEEVAQVIEEEAAPSLSAEVVEEEAALPLSEEALEEEPDQFLSEEVVEEEAALSPSEEAAQIAQATVKELLEKMRVQAQVTVREPQEDQLLTLDIIGQDLGVLLGPRGETLNALQYIARLITSRELLHWATFFLDVEGYRERRAKELQDLAHRMAERVALTNQPLVLEPMPAHERRLIHIALRSHPLITTQSVGQGEHRRVTILPRG
jgi:spoIIIJ-associated protein